MTVALNEEINWEEFVNFDDADNLDFFDGGAAADDNFDFFDTTSLPFPATAGVDSWIGEVEELLMRDDDDNNNENCGGNSISSEFLQDFGLDVADLLQDFPVVEESRPPSSEPEAEVVNADKNSPASSPSVGNDGCDVGLNNNNNNKGSSSNIESNCENEKSSDDVNDDDNDDPLSKKRKRQLRNRDAAMRSRERKKMHVKELEMKSRYYEDECRKLRRFLDAVYSENQMLRLSLQTYGAPMTRPESAVLLLESLLLGSLVWFLVNICLLPQSNLLLLSQDAGKLVNGDRKVLESATSKGKGTKTSEMWLALSFTRSKRCRASRTKMKSHPAVLCF